MYYSKKSVLEKDLSLLKSFEKLQSGYRKLLLESKAFSTIIELRDKECLNWNQIAGLLENKRIKTVGGGQRWKGRNVARIYRREKSKSGKTHLINHHFQQTGWFILPESPQGDLRIRFIDHFFNNIFKFSSEAQHIVSLMKTCSALLRPSTKSCLELLSRMNKVVDQQIVRQVILVKWGD